MCPTLGGVSADTGAGDGLARGLATLGVTSAQRLKVDGRGADQSAVLGAA